MEGREATASLALGVACRWRRRSGQVSGIQVSLSSLPVILIVIYLALQELKRALNEGNNYKGWTDFKLRGDFKN